MTPYRLIILFCLCNILQINAQEQLGLRIDNYAGINSALLNPANPLSYPLRWDLNLVAASQFADNNYAYFADASLRDILNNIENIYIVPFEEGSSTTDDLVVDFNTKNSRKFVSIFTQVTGPSASIKIGDNNSVGFFTNLKAAFSTQSIPANLGFYQVYDTEFTERLSVEEGMVAGMVWSEIGLSYARRLYAADGYIGIGANLKILNGYEAGFARNLAPFQVAQLAADTINLDSPNIEFGYTNSNADIIDSGSFSRSKNGSGVAVDLGFTYVYEGGEDNYKLKLGASILDFGRIKFNRNAGKYSVNYDGAMDFAGKDYSAYTNPDDLAEALSQQIYNDIDAIRIGNEFSVWLPTAISLQADYMVIPMFYVNGVLVQRFPALGAAVERGNMLAFTPRFEHQWFAAALPIVVYNYKQVNLGATVRLGYLTLGTENLGSLMSSSSDFTGTDFYIGLKINPFNLGLNLGGGFGGGGKKVKCYDF